MWSVQIQLQCLVCHHRILFPISPKEYGLPASKKPRVNTATANSALPSDQD